MDNQHRKVSGYRELSQDEIDDMNRVKMLGSKIGELIEEFSKMPSYDQRWVNIAKTQYQQAGMALARAIAQPEGF